MSSDNQDGTATILIVALQQKLDTEASIGITFVAGDQGEGPSGVMGNGSSKDGVRAAAFSAALTIGVAVILGLLIKTFLGIDPTRGGIPWILLFLGLAVLFIIRVVGGWLSRRR